MKTFPASTVSSVAPPSAAAAVETSSFCERVNVAILSSKIVKRPGSKCSQHGNFLRLQELPLYVNCQDSLAATNLDLIQIKKLRTKVRRLRAFRERAHERFRIAAVQTDR
jgi:hypothetical protein